MNRIFKSIHLSNVYKIIKPTALEKHNYLYNNILLKREDTFPIFSFKLRGAYNKLSQLSDSNKYNGVVACSAGNHAQGVAMASELLNIKSTIVMPEVTPDIKVTAVRSYGADVILYGKDFDEAKEYADMISKKKNVTMIHPYDDYDVIAGQGTIAKELLNQIRGDKLDIIFCPVGGGGLITGIGCYFKTLSPTTKIIGVESIEANAMTQSICIGERIKLDKIGTFADGVAVKQVGEIPFQLCKEIGIEMITVHNDDIYHSIKYLYNQTRTIMEPAGALAMAGCISYIENNDITDKNIVVITSGANMDFNRLRYISEKADRNEATFVIEIPEKTGSFLELYRKIYPINITQLSYQYDCRETASVIMSIKYKSDNEKSELYNTLSQYYSIIDKTNDEIFMDHQRYMLPTNTTQPINEYRFEFPERPGELLHFLTKLDQGINIILFHYRNYGSDKGKVLVGFSNQIDHIVSDIGYPYIK